MAKLSGWQKAGLFAGAGCLSIIGVLVLGLIVAIGWARSTVAELGDPTPADVERTISLDAPAAPDAEPLRLRIDLEEGTFTIRPAEAGAQVQVTGTYAPGLYELTEDHQTGEAGGARRTTIRFRSKAPQWARMLAGIGADSAGRPAVTVLIPEGTAMDLSLRVSMGESRIDLGGLTLRDLDVEMSMGEHVLDFAEPVVEGVRRVRLSTSMGNVSVENLGNARAQSVETSGSMGNVTADLGGAWEPGSTAELTFAQSMGELTLRAPSNVRLETDFAESEERQRVPPSTVTETTDPSAPVLRLRVSTSMGETRVVRY